MSQGNPDFRASHLSELKWDSENAPGSLVKVLAYALAQADGAIEWYLKAKRSKRQWARWLRMGAILFTAMAGILPVLIQIQQTRPQAWSLAPGWASVMLAIALLFVAVDRFFGFSAAWMRYITAELQIKQLKEGFELDAHAALASFQGRAPSPEQLQGMLASIRSFVDQVNTIVAQETAKWVDEFREALKQIDENVRSPGALASTGSLQVVVHNAEQAPDGWSLAIDNGAPVRYRGKSAAATALPAGDHLVRVSAEIGGKPLRAEAVAPVRAGGIANIELTLSE